ncbi:MAG: hypothetical protein L7F77_12220 [Candidatus Magnetominusculus sp. LBB02]|nr:hypothetical protein [Candidatus Magnetominusculus sp. LBB02]
MAAEIDTSKILECLRGAGIGEGVSAEIAEIFRAEIEKMRRELEAEIEKSNAQLRQAIMAEIERSKAETIKWIVAMA